MNTSPTHSEIERISRMPDDLTPVAVANDTIIVTLPSKFRKSTFIPPSRRCYEGTLFYVDLMLVV